MNVSPLLLRARRVLPAALLLIFAFAPQHAAAQPGMPTGANYTDDMPSVAKVKSTIQGSDPIDTAARQTAVFDELVSYIDRVHTNRDVRAPMTPGEATLFGEYRGASAQIAQDYTNTKSRSAADIQRYNQLEGKYSFDSAFMNAWPKQLIVGQANAALQNANAGLSASSKRMYDQQMQQNQQTQAQTTNAQGLSNDPTAVATRRCLELGGDNMACVGKSFLGGLMDMVTGPGGLDALTGPGRAGVVLSGAYGSGTHVSFGGDAGTLVGCGKLADDAYAYTLSKTASALKVTLATKPTPVVLTMRPDGSLIGPGLTTITGRVITGYEVVTHYKNGAVIGQDRIPQYSPATDRCTIGALAAPAPPAPSSNADSAQMGGMLGAMMNTVASVAPASLPGLRMEGKYSSSGLQFDFGGDAVTLDCGQAHVKSPYTVENAASALIVHVKNSGGPFDLVVSSNNALRGAGSTTINGRLVTGMNGDNVTFMPHSETCQIGSYSPQSGAASTTTVAANSSPAPVAATPISPANTPTTTAPISATTASTGSMTLAITSSFPIAKNPLAGAIVKLMTDRFDNVLRKAGAPIPAGTTPGQALAAYVQNCPPPGGCPGPAQLMKPYYVGTATFDANGTATIHASVPPGSYYIICSAGTSGALVWDMPVTLKAEQSNAIQLTATNAELVK